MRVPSQLGAVLSFFSFSGPFLTFITTFLVERSCRGSRCAVVCRRPWKPLIYFVLLVFHFRGHHISIEMELDISILPRYLARYFSSGLWYCSLLRTS